ncbi:hypothetical protein [Salinicola halophilus]|uniref:hypothetical protein n=1 Tax=Salinicola halophilus TaxID=184065 RepID=UPI0013A644AA|nr:hypothetical protein [Salinicola halophilus]
MPPSDDPSDSRRSATASPAGSDRHAAPSRQIVPDRRDAGGTRRPSSRSTATPRRGPRVWPLWLLVLLLAGALGAVIWQYQHDRQMWSARFERLDQRIAATGSTLDSAGEDLRASLNDIEQRLEASRAATGSLETRLADASDNSETQERLDTLRSTVDNQQTLITALQRSFSALESTAEDERGALAARISTLEGNDASVDERLETLTQRLDATRSQDQELETRQQTLSASLESLEQSQAALADRIDQRDSTGVDAAEVERLEASIDSLERSLAESKDEIAALSERAAPSTEDIASLQGAVTELRQGQTALSAALEGVQSRVANLPSGTSSAQIRDIQARLDSLDASRAQLTRRVTSLMADVANLQRSGG